MLATLPGRSHGLALFTESFVAEFQIGRVEYGAINFWATLLGSLFCLPCGWLLDRLGIRAMLALVLFELGVVVLGIALLPAGLGPQLLPSADLFSGKIEILEVPGWLFALLLLTRGLGQSALSVISLALIGKAAGRTPGPVVAVYSILVSVSFILAFVALKAAFEYAHLDWRTIWGSMGVSLLAAVAIVLLLFRNPSPATTELELRPEYGVTLPRALFSPAFWVFAMSISLYGLISAGVSIFGEAMLKDRGFSGDVFRTISIVGPLVGLAANLVTGLAVRRYGMGRLLGMAMALLASALLVFPYVETLLQVYVYAVMMGIAGGMITVLFFSVWGPAYGPLHLGKIQGVAQLLTVLASAVGPLVLAESHRATGSYTAVFQQLVCVALVFAVLAWSVPIPKFADGGSER